jgi:hypothetical protein
MPVTIVSFTDHKMLTEHTIETIGDQLAMLADQLDPVNLVLNFGGVQFHDLCRRTGGAGKVLRQLLSL